MCNNKGFTLIELLAVIVILAIIMLITTPTVLNIIENARVESFKTSVYGIINTVEQSYAKETLTKSFPTVVTYIYKNGKEISSNKKELKFKGKKPESGMIIINNNGVVSLALYNRVYCAVKDSTTNEVEVEKTSSSECELSYPCGTDLFDFRDGELYRTLKIGDQCWMAEDLRYDCSKSGYNNIGSANSWSGSNNCGDGEYNTILYQWPVAMDGSTEESSQGLCPSGWHIPSDDEWKKLEQHLGMTVDEVNKPDWRGNDQGDQLKSLQYNWCLEANSCGTSGFDAMPVGGRQIDGKFYNVDSTSYWWTSTISDTSAWVRRINNINTNIYRNNPTQLYGRGVRCIININN